MSASTGSLAHERAMSRVLLARRIRRWTLVLGIAALVAGYFLFGARWVPADMDTVPAIPPGSFCIVDKRTSAVRVGSHVFVEVPGSGVVLSRVATRTSESLTVRHPNPASRWPDSRTIGSLPLAAVRGTVLGAFPADEDDERGG